MIKNMIQLQLTSIEDNLYAKVCLEVMNHIYSKINFVIDENETISEQNYMMTFAYLLGCKLKDENQLVGGEKEKVLHYLSSIQEVVSLRERLKRTGSVVTVKPDLVIHDSHNRQNMNRNNQKMVIEAKTSKSLSSDSFCWDLVKLYAYVKELEYNCAVYLIIGQKEGKINNLLGKYEENSLPNDDGLERILLFVQQDVKSWPLVEKLKRE